MSTITITYANTEDLLFTMIKIPRDILEISKFEEKGQEGYFTYTEVINWVRRIARFDGTVELKSFNDGDMIYEEVLNIYTFKYHHTRSTGPIPIEQAIAEKWITKETVQKVVRNYMDWTSNKVLADIVLDRLSS